jgi:hypothetical protein
MFSHSLTAAGGPGHLNQDFSFFVLKKEIRVLDFVGYFSPPGLMRDRGDAKDRATESGANNPFRLVDLFRNLI